MGGKTTLIKYFAVTTAVLCFCSALLVHAMAATKGACHEAHKALGQREYESVEALLQKCNDIDTRDEQGSTILMRIAGIRSKLRVVDAFQRRVAKYLMDRGSDVRARDDLGRTALMRTEHPEIAKMLVENGARVDAADKQGSTTLILLSKRHKSKFSAWIGDLALIEFLLKNGANVNAKDHSGKTALIWATIHCNVPAAKRLLEAGAKVNERDGEGKTALSYFRAVSQQDRALYEGDRLEALLMEHGAKEQTPRATDN